MSKLEDRASLWATRAVDLLLTKHPTRMSGFAILFTGGQLR